MWSESGVSSTTSGVEGSGVDTVGDDGGAEGTAAACNDIMTDICGRAREAAAFLGGMASSRCRLADVVRPVGG